MNSITPGSGAPLPPPSVPEKTPLKGESRYSISGKFMGIKDEKNLTDMFTAFHINDSKEHTEQVAPHVYTAETLKSSGRLASIRAAWNRLFSKSVSSETIVKRLMQSATVQDTIANIPRYNKRIVQYRVRDAITLIINDVLSRSETFNNDPNYFHKVNISLGQKKISVLLRTDEKGQIVEFYSKGAKKGQGTFKNVRAVVNYITKKSSAFLASLTSGKTRNDAVVSEEEAVDSKEDVSLDYTNTHRFLDLAKHEKDQTGFPSPQRLITWISKGKERSAIVTDLADCDGFDFIHKKGKDPTPEERLSCVKQLANVLTIMRKHNLSHNDVKTENVLISGRGKKIKLRLVDFSSVTTVGTKADSVTHHYTNPNGNHSQQDVHAYAMTAYKIAIGGQSQEGDMKSAALYLELDEENEPKKNPEFTALMGKREKVRRELIEKHGLEKGEQLFRQSTEWNSESVKINQFEKYFSEEKSKLQAKFGPKKGEKLAEGLRKMVVLTEGGPPPDQSAGDIQEFLTLLKKL